MTGPASRQRGVSLVELMIALVIGLIIVASVSQVFLSGKRSYGTQAGLGALQENGRFALYFLQRDLQFAGFPQRIGPSGSSLEVPTPFDTSRTLDGGTGSDEVTAWWNADADVEDSNLDCLGQETTTGPVWSRYFVEDAALKCEGSGNPDRPQPLIENVDSFQAQYGLDSDGDGWADLYVPANEVANWGAVVAVRVAVLLNSGEITREDIDAADYSVLDAPTFTPTDDTGTAQDERRFARRVFTTTVEIRNRSTV